LFQLVLNKNYSGATHFNEPWLQVEEERRSAVA
jgi:hypothetical protein